LAKLLGALRRNVRTVVQLCWTALTNGYAAGFAKGTIYKGELKRVCVPGLNCYSCPGALGACPIGSLQAVLGDRNHWFSFYVVGFLLLFGAVLGRFVCGWLCPFGLVQDLLHKIPFPKKLKRLPSDRVLKYLRYVVLVGFVIILPLTALDVVGQGSPWYCKYICPSGTLFAGIPLVASNPALQSALGWIFNWKVAILVVLLLLSVVVYRPFCRYLCPLGAIYGLFNPIAFYRYEVDSEKCVDCGLCARACGFGIRANETPNSTECIRCGQCIKACPHGAICSTLSRRRAKKKA
jgi:hypothetical protein